MVGREHEAHGPVDRRSRLPLPAGDPSGEVVEPLQGTRRAEDVGGPGMYGRDSGLVGQGQIDQSVTQVHQRTQYSMPRTATIPRS